MPQRILVVHPGAELYGSDRMLLESVIGFIEAGDEVTVMLAEDGELANALTKVGARVGILPMLVLRKALLAPRAWPRLITITFRGLGSAWRTITRVRPDVVYVSTITIPQWPLLARLRGIPAVTHVHEAEGSASVWVLRALYAPHLASRAIIANSRFSAEVLGTAISRLRSRTTVVWNAVPGPPVRSDPRERLDVLRILYIGRLSPRKGPDLAVEALAVLRSRGIPARLDVVGDVFAGYEWFQSELRARIASVSLDGEVREHGFQPDVWGFLADADVLVVPSRVDEPFGNTAVEGILSMRPVVLADTSGLREAGGGYPTAIFVRPDDFEALANGLESVVRSWPELVRSAPASAAAARERHSVEVYRAAVRSVLAGVIVTRR